MNDDLRDLENDFKKQLAFFHTLQDSTELVDNFENLFNQLSNEIPQVNKTLKKMKETLKEYEKLIHNGLKDNINYDEDFAHTEEKDIKAYDHKLDDLSKRMDALHKDLQNMEEVRQEVLERKFKDTNFVGQQLQKLMAIASQRDQLKKEYDQIKHGIKDKREKYSNLQIDAIVQDLDARINQVQRNENNLQKLVTKQPKNKDTQLTQVTFKL